MSLNGPRHSPRPSRTPEASTSSPADPPKPTDLPTPEVPRTIAEEQSAPEQALENLRRQVTKPAPVRAETPPQRTVPRRPRQTTINGLMLIVALIAVAFVAVRGEINNSRYTDATSAEAVAANRTKAVAELQRPPDGHVCAPGLPVLAADLNLECANRALAAARREVVPDPGPEVTPSQMAALLGLALKRLDDAGVRPGGAPREGVTTPPTSGRFRGAR